MNFDHSFDPGGVGDLAVRRVLPSLIGRAGLTRQDRPDLIQELTARVLAGLAGYDPKRGTLAAFVNVLADRAAQGVLRDRMALCRADGWDVPDPDAPRLDPRPDRTADLRIDLGELIAGLPPELRQAMAAIGRAVTLTSAAADLGVTRAVLNGRVARVRKWATAARLHEYATNPPNTFPPVRQLSLVGGQRPRRAG